MITNEELATKLAAQTAPKVSPERVSAVIASSMFLRPTGTLTICVLTLANGFTVTGESACASPENFNQEIGEKIAYDNAKQKIWALEGYALRQDLARAARAEVQPGPGMKQYVGTKVINAMPMTRLAYNELRGWALPADENGADDGYLVEYADGQRPNVEGFAGYVSWSPADVFERAYVAGL